MVSSCLLATVLFAPLSLAQTAGPGAAPTPQVAPPQVAPPQDTTGKKEGDASGAKGPPHASGRRLAQPPKIDGKIEPEEWKGAFPINDLRDTLTGQPPADKTTVYVGYDDRAIYVAFRCEDAQPNAIVGREITPNSRFEGEDTVEVAINALGNRTFDASRFEVNVLGTKRERIAGGRADKREWRGDWDAATSRDEGGWTCEIAIPWTMLNYPRSKAMSMGINFTRNQARTRIESSWANATPNPRPENDGYWDAVSPPPPPAPRPQFLVYGAPEFDAGKVGFRAGGDVRYPLSPTLYALGSIAPDFRNIENFVAGVEFTRVERFVGDARPFFTEGSGFFNLNRGYTFGDMFYSRRIGEFDFGGKVYGQLTPNTSLGAFTSINLAGQRAAVVNYGKTFSPTASANVYFTANGAGPGSESVGPDPGPIREDFAFGASGGSRYGNVTLGGAFASEGTHGLGSNAAAAVTLNYSAPRVFSQVKYYEVSAGFDPALGYIPWRDRQGTSSYSQVEREYRTGPLRYANVSFSHDDFRTYRGDIQQSGYNVGTYLQTRKDLSFSLGKERYTYFGKIDDVTSYGLGVNVSNRFKQFRVNYDTGTRNDLPSTFTSFSGSYRLGSRLDLGYSQSIQRFDGTSSLSILTAGYQLSPTRAVTGRVVIRDGRQNAYLAYRSAGGRGTDVFLILGDPNADTTVARVSLKLVRAF